ncbi:hypothetical protein MK079_00320 [Candidatus Gracilibacteria bacterium]|nr:hypothetical protein [Candidatus Gracilibacteria bacterium]
MKTFLKHLLIQISILVTLGISYAAWNDVINSGDPLTATAWNELATKVAELNNFSFSSGNIGVGTSTPTNLLEIGDAGHSGYALTTRTPVYGTVIQTEAEGNNATFWVRSNVDATPIESLYIRNNGNVGVGTTTPNTTLDVNGNINLRKKNFAANNSDWISLEYNMVQDSGGGAVLVMCSTNYNTSGGRIALYLVRGTHSSTSTIEDVYLGGTRDMFSFRNNNGNLEVRGWDSGIGLATNAACSVISMGNN